jgi:hypothetical protein
VSSVGIVTFFSVILIGASDDEFIKSGIVAFDNDVIRFTIGLNVFLF